MNKEKNITEKDSDTVDAIKSLEDRYMAFLSDENLSTL